MTMCVLVVCHSNPKGSVRPSRSSLFSPNNLFSSLMSFNLETSIPNTKGATGAYLTPWMHFRIQEATSCLLATLSSYGRSCSYFNHSVAISIETGCLILPDVAKLSPLVIREKMEKSSSQQRRIVDQTPVKITIDNQSPLFK
jgi:hypothetical protein